jgi:hypothetical protein
MEEESGYNDVGIYVKAEGLVALSVMWIMIPTR